MEVVAAQAADGTPVCHAVLSDITDRKQTENAQLFLLQCGSAGENFFESLARYLSQSLGMAYVCIDRLLGDRLSAQTVAIYFDGKFEANVAYTLQDTPCGDVVGKTICCFPREVRHLFPQDVVLQEMQAESYVGTTLWSSQGQPIGLIAVIGRQPLANPHLAEAVLKLVAVRAAGELERQQAEGELRESEEKYRAIVDTTSDFIMRYDRAGRHLYGNPAALKVTGVTLEAYVGKTHRDLGFPEHLCRLWEEQLETVFRTGAAVTVEFEVELAEDNKYLELRLCPEFASDGSVNTVVGISRDSTERKQMEEALRRFNSELEQRVEERTALLNATNWQLVSAMRSKDEFLAAMSHELRTPLTAILGLAELLQMQTYGPLTEKQAYYAQAIYASGQHLLALINDVLDLAKLAAGQTQLVPGPVNISEACQVALQLTKPQADKRQIAASLTLDPAATHLQADERRLKQILVNLLSNAVKFTPTGGQVGLMVVGDEKQGVVEFTVWDTGIGIATEDLSRLFQDFVQLDARLARDYEGTGLGLALVRRLAELHGGQVKAESDGLGKGSRFTVSLPWEPAASAPQPTAEPTTPTDAARPLTRPVVTSEASLILEVDDQPALLLAIQGILKANAYQVEALADRRIALALARQLRPALVVMDLQMPKLDGLEAIRQMRADPVLISTPILALTARAMPGDRERCLDAGANDYLSKPVNLKEFVSAVRRLVKA